MLQPELVPCHYTFYTQTYTHLKERYSLRISPSFSSFYFEISNFYDFQSIKGLFAFVKRYKELK
jgi:hypothetical protein